MHVDEFTRVILSTNLNDHRHNALCMYMYVDEFTRVNCLQTTAQTNLQSFVDDFTRVKSSGRFY